MTIRAFRTRRAAKLFRPFEEGGAAAAPTPEPTPEPKEEAPEPAPKQEPPKPEAPKESPPEKKKPGPKHETKKQEEKEEDAPDVEQEKDVVRDILDKLFGPAPKQVANFIKTHGAKTIKSIQVCRAPVQAAVSKMMDVITLGKFSQVKNKVGYDNFYHLWMNITLEDGKKFLLEKNQLVKVGSPKSSSDCIDVKVKPVTLAEAFQKGIAKVGKEKFWRYQALSTNCQHFVAAFLSGSGMYTTSVKAFVYQPLDQLIKELPAFGKKASRKITDVAAYIDSFIQFFTKGRVALKRGAILMVR